MEYSKYAEVKGKEVPCARHTFEASLALYSKLVDRCLLRPSRCHIPTQD